MKGFWGFGEQYKQLEFKHRFQDYVHKQRDKLIQSGAHSSSSSSSSSSNNNSNSHHHHQTRKGNNHQNHTISEADKIRNHIIQSMPVYIPKDYIFESRQFDHRKSHPLTLNLANYDNIKNVEREQQHDNQIIAIMESEWNAILEAGKNIIFTPLREDRRKRLLYNY